MITVIFTLNLANYVKSDNILCYVCQNTATHELNMLGKR